MTLFFPLFLSDNDESDETCIDGFDFLIWVFPHIIIWVAFEFLD